MWFRRVSRQLGWNFLLGGLALGSLGGGLARDTGMGRPEVQIIPGEMRPAERTTGIFCVLL